MDGIWIIGILAAVGLAIAARKPKKDPEDIEDQPVSAEDVERGVKNGWYEAILTRVDGQPAVRLTGKLANGENYTDIFRTTQKDFDKLQEKGYLIV